MIDRPENSSIKFPQHITNWQRRVFLLWSTEVEKGGPEQTPEALDYEGAHITIVSRWNPNCPFSIIIHSENEESHPI